MAVIEINGGPITHRYLMGKTKDELASMYMRLLRDTEQDARDAERYRWLRCADNQDGNDMYVVFDGTIPHYVADIELDSAIDAAMNGANA